MTDNLYKFTSICPPTGGVTSEPYSPKTSYAAVLESRRRCHSQILVLEETGIYELVDDEHNRTRYPLLVGKRFNRPPPTSHVKKVADSSNHPVWPSWESFANVYAGPGVLSGGAGGGMTPPVPPVVPVTQGYLDLEGGGRLMLEDGTGFLKLESA